jgi:NDP-sugar pyrophosphorylase family protein
MEFSEIFVTLGYAAPQVRQFLEKVALQHRVTPIVAPNWEQGPLASFQAVLPHLAHDAPSILLPGDLYLSPNILRLITTTSAEIALLYDPGVKHPGALLRVDTANTIQQLVQSSVYLPDFFSVLPVLRGNRRFFTEALALQAAPPLTVFDLLKGWLAEGYPLFGIPIHEDVWCDVDSPADLVGLNHYLLTKGWPPTPRPPGTYLPPGTSMTGPVSSSALSLGAGSVIEGPALLGAGVTIDEGCVITDGTSLGQATTVHANTSLTRCLTLPYTQVPANVDLRTTILDAQGNVVR